MINKKVLLSIIGLFVIVVVCVSIYLLIPKATLEISIAPGNADLVTNNGTKKSVSNGDVIKIAPGDYTFTVSRNEFDSYSVKMVIKNNESAELLVALKPQTDAARQLLLDTASQAIVQRFYGKSLAEQTNQLNKNYPILSVLPIQERLYTIDACPSQKYPNDSTKIALCVTETDSSLNDYALAVIRQKGYNPDDYEIIFSIQNTTQSTLTAD